MKKYENSVKIPIPNELSMRVLCEFLLVYASFDTIVRIRRPKIKKSENKMKMENKFWVGKEPCFFHGFGVPRSRPLRPVKFPRNCTTIYVILLTFGAVFGIADNLYS